MKTLTFKTHRNANVQAKLLKRFIDNNPLVEIEFIAENEDMAPDWDDEEGIKRIEREYNNGNFYAWFCAHVKVTYKGFEADDYLGGCSYKSERDFKENSGYYIDMISECIDQINKEIADHNNYVCKMFKTRQLKRMADSLGFIVIPKTAIV